MTDDLDGEQPVPLSWAESCAVYHINQTGLPADEDTQDVYRAIRRSFEEWDSVSCSYFSLIDGGFTSEDRVGYNSCDSSANTNMVIFRASNWQHPRGALALTSVTYELQDGQIVDADIEINNTGIATFSTTDVQGEIEIDVQNTVTHEIGHLVGLDHVQDGEATMYLTAPRGETQKRSLESDDIAGICAIYPAGGSIPACRPRNVGFFAKPEEGPDVQGTVCENGGSDCVCGATDARPGPTAGLLALLALVGIARRRGR